MNLYKYSRQGPNTLRLEPNVLWRNESDNIGIHHVCMNRFETEVTAVSLWNGRVNFVSSRTGVLTYSYKFDDTQSVVTCSRFLPQNNTCFSVSSSGKFGMYEYTTNKMIFESRVECDIYTCDISSDNKIYAMAGRDAEVYVYDLKNNKPIVTLDKISSNKLCHSNRIYSLVFQKKDPNIIFTGAWDSTVLMWDVRSGIAEKLFGGPLISGDTVDVRDNLLLTGAWREKDPIQLWDISSAKVIKSGNWGGEGEQCNLYACKFFENEDAIIAGGAGSKNFKVFNLELVSTGRHGTYEKPINGAASHGGVCVVADQQGVFAAFRKQKSD